EGKTVFFRDALNVAPGTQVFRTFDKQFSDALNRSSAERRIAVDATLRYLNNRIYLTLTDEYNNSVTCCSAPIALEEANTAQSERQMGVLAKMGDSIFEMRNAQVLGQLFIPSSLLTSLRRDTVEALTSLRQTTHPRSYRKDEDRGVLYPYKHLISSDNVANHLADEVYREHGVEGIEPAIEITGKSENGVLMNTRYCLRRELGACRLEPNGKSLPDKLFLRNGNTRLEVVCDCAVCEMKIKIASK
ncbi:MAG: DUF3656 domain-containing protein, partial [Muribaculaceae bacterium]|nr:DUF3656 domain-containing protein [Muribaculaceae bacterium]